MKRVLVLLALATSSALAAAGRASAVDVPEPGLCALPSGGEFEVLTYNVHGLPPPFTPDRHQRENNGKMSPLLNDYPLALVQEDFFFHRELSSQATHPHQAGPTGPVCIRVFSREVCLLPGDGLGRFSLFPFGTVYREKWQTCHGGPFDGRETGNDCLAQKGFTAAATFVDPCVPVDVYDIHLDSGSTDNDFRARAQQVEQLLAAITRVSPDRAVIVAGDTNLHVGRVPTDPNLPSDDDTLSRLMDGAGLADACREVGCGNEQIDRVFYRSSAAFTLRAVEWRIDARFVDEGGSPLSDHLAIAVRLAWEGRGVELVE